MGLLTGFGLSLALAAAGRDAITNTLYKVSALDPVTYLAVFVLITVISLVAGLVPAWRATRVDPIIALRAE